MYSDLSMVKKKELVLAQATLKLFFQRVREREKKLFYFLLQKMNVLSQYPP